MEKVYLSLGSNLGDRVENLWRAVQLLSGVVRVAAVSSVYETDPLGVPDQPAFLNLALGGRTDLAPGDLLARVKEIEREVGRRPTFRWGPRVVDIDILMMGDRVIEGDTLQVPHPEMGRRAFVLIPLAEIAPNVVHPASGLTVEQMAQRVDGEGVRLSPFTVAVGTGGAEN